MGRRLQVPRGILVALCFALYLVLVWIAYRVSFIFD